MNKNQRKEFLRAEASLDARVEAIFKASPYCAVCSERIESAKDASLFIPVAAPETLICRDGGCFEKMLGRSMDRYVKWTERATV